MYCCLTPRLLPHEVTIMGAGRDYHVLLPHTTAPASRGHHHGSWQRLPCTAASHHGSCLTRSPSWELAETIMYCCLTPRLLPHEVTIMGAGRDYHVLLPHT